MKTMFSDCSNCSILHPLHFVFSLTKTDMVKDQLLFRHGFQQDGPFPLHIGPAASVCVGGCLADLAGELEELKCPFFLSAGFSAQVLF